MLYFTHDNIYAHAELMEKTNCLSFLSLSTVIDAQPFFALVYVLMYFSRTYTANVQIVSISLFLYNCFVNPLQLLIYRDIRKTILIILSWLVLTCNAYGKPAYGHLKRHPQYNKRPQLITIQPYFNTHNCTVYYHHRTWEEAR